VQPYLFFRNWSADNDMTPQIFSCAKYLKMECPSWVVFAIKANHQDFMLVIMEIGFEQEWEFNLD